MKIPNTEPPPVAQRIAPGRLVRAALLLGGAMIAAGWVWSLGFEGHGLGALFPRDRWLADLLAGAGGGAVFALAAWTLVERLPAFQRIERLLIAVLDMPALRYRHAVAFGLLAGVPEEILFRGALQPVLGLVITSILFGALHAVTRAYFVYAAGAGLLLGVLAEWSGGLWAPIAAHTVIDVIMFTLLIAAWRRSRAGPVAYEESG